MTQDKILTILRLVLTFLVTLGVLNPDFIDFINPLIERGLFVVSEVILIVGLLRDKLAPQNELSARSNTGLVTRLLLLD